MTRIDIDHLRKWVGREQTVEDSLNLFPARALGSALEHPALLSVGDTLPLSWHWLYFLETPKSSATGTDGHPQKGDFLPPIQLPRRMWAGGSLKIIKPLRLGSPASKHSSIRSVDYKRGKSGELVFVILDHELSQGGKLCLHEEQTLVYRAMPTERAPLPPGDPTTSAPDWSSTFEPDPVALFRFSALTYNAHRIHYDRDYAIHQEFYPGLVVHAPLLVTLLLDLLASETTAVPLSAVRFRAIRPTFDLAPVQLHGKQDGRHVNLWTADSDNYIGISAIATLEQSS